MIPAHTTDYFTALEDISRMIGNTPVFDFSRLSPNPEVQILAKAEWRQFGGSVKSRPAFNIIREAVIAGKLTPGKVILDASSGNTAISYAAIGAYAGIKVVIVLPENASKMRINILKSMGAEIVFTSPFGGTDEAQHEASRMFKNNPDMYFYADQYNNPDNWKVHYEHTGWEVWQQSKGRITHFITGLGTTGSFTGISKKLKELKSGVRCIALQPDSAMHIMEGWKHLETAKVPGIFDPFIADEQRIVASEEAVEMLLFVAKQEGLLLSPSAAANITGAVNLASQLDKGVIVTLLPDNGDKYGEFLNEIV